jgi:hypothetical protein
MVKNYYSSVEEAPMGKGRKDRDKKKVYSKANTTKKNYKYVKDDRPGRTRKKKIYVGKLSDAQARARKAMTSDKAYALPFGETFKQARKSGKDSFRWKGKQYHTKTKSELEGAIGAKEKERFERAGKAKTSTSKTKTSTSKKGNIFSRMATKLRGGHSTQKGYEAAKEKRIKAKRIAWMEKRKAAGKSYSKKNLAGLKAKS